jgi:hypothetical protein
MSSSRVRSAPRAKAMVEMRWMAFRRMRTSSCYKEREVRTVEKRRGVGCCSPGDVFGTFSSSIRTAMG